jgi:thioredoxin reductase
MDYLVIGAGPAGLRLGWSLEQAGRDYLILEAGATPGVLPRSFPRAFAADRPRGRADVAGAERLKVRCHARVTRVARDGGGDSQFVVIDQTGHIYRARRVIVATGLGRPYLPPIPGIEAAERYDDGPVVPADFAGRRVLVIGAGDVAYETAGGVVEHAAAVHVVGPRAIPAALTDRTGRRWAGNDALISPGRLAARHAVLDASVQRIERAGQAEYVVTVSYAGWAGQIRTARLRYDRVIACTGFQMDSTIFDASCRPEPALGGRLPALTSEWESVNVPDLFFAGALTRVRAPRQHAGALRSGLRYGIRALRRVLDRKYEGAEWPHLVLPADAEVLATAVLARVNESLGLLQRYAPLCDLIVVTLRDTTAWYYEEMPVDYVHDSLFGSADRYFTVTLEYGDGRTVELDDEHDDDRYLHPVIRHYHRWALVAVQRLPEDMGNDWASEAEYKMPLRAFFAQQMAMALA